MEIIHWRLYFAIGASETIEFNSQRLGTGTDTRTRLFIHHRNYLTSKNDPFATKEIAVNGTHAIEKIFQSFIGDRKLDQYRLTALGSGCRFWCQNALQDLETDGVLPGGTSVTLENWIKGLNTTHGNDLVPYPLLKGTFY